MWPYGLQPITPKDFKTEVTPKEEVNTVPVCWQHSAFSCCYHFKITLM